MATSRKTKINSLLLLGLSFALLFAGCSTDKVADAASDMPQNNWSYPNKIKLPLKIDRPDERHNVYFTLRVTAAYRYSNIYILFKIKGPNGKEVTRRYGFKLAAADGQWLGKGSGNLYAYKFPLLTKDSFTEKGNYELSVEQNMRDNPLTGISDAGLQVFNDVD